MRWSFVVACVVLAGACSASDPNASPTSPTSAHASSLPSTAAADGALAGSDSDSAEPTSGDVVPSVRIDVDVGGSTAELSGVLAESGDPFAQFVSCSGLRESFGSYSVLASAPAGDVRSISVVSSDLVTDPGVHDAAVRVEYANAPAVDAVGTMTLVGDWRSGTFVAFGADGVEVSGSFDCPTDMVAAPLSVDPAADELEAVEIFALIRAGDAQRIVGSAADAGGTATIECPGAGEVGDESDLVVRVVGDDRTGAVTVFELTEGASPTLTMTVGDVDYEFERVERGGSDLPAAGSFGARTDAVEIDGAFRCS